MRRLLQAFDRCAGPAAGAPARGTSDTTRAGRYGFYASTPMGGPDGFFVDVEAYGVDLHADGTPVLDRPFRTRQVPVETGRETRLRTIYEALFDDALDDEGEDE